jgi:hypothetical protein
MDVKVRRASPRPSPPAPGLRKVNVLEFTIGRKWRCGCRLMAVLGRRTQRPPQYRSGPRLTPLAGASAAATGSTLLRPLQPLLLAIGLEPPRQARRLVAGAGITARTRRTGCATGALMRALPRLIWMDFADPAGVIAKGAGHRHRSPRLGSNS